MTDAPKLSLYVHETCLGSVQGIGVYFANNVLDCTRSILVTTRPDAQCNQDTERLTPAEFTALAADGAIKRGHMTGAALVIDAQPVYDSGRTLHTIKKDEVIRLARQAIKQFGKVMRHLVVVCDEGDRLSILTALSPEVATC